MFQYTFPVNTQVLFTILDPAGTTGTPPTDLTMIFNGAVVTTPVVTVTDLATKGLYNVTFTPQATGTYMIYAYGQIQGIVNVVVQTIETYLQDLLDESQGSWSWDKVGGVLTMVRQNGQTLATFNVVDNLTTASRELIT
jgi:hypothetical protein